MFRLGNIQDCLFKEEINKKMNKLVKISVGVTTYNQQDTIAQTLDSILSQKGDFALELVLGEDCSSDSTYAICCDYAKRFPDIIRLLPNTHNLGIMANCSRVMQACTGEYLGICAGDDYWCDEYKLQKQLDYFISHPEVGVVSTAGYQLLVKSNRLVPNAVDPIHPIKDGNIKPFYFSLSYMGGVYATPLTLLIKREVFKYVDLNEFVIRKFPVEDFPMQAILAQHTLWGHISDLCVVYRVYKESATFISFDHPNYLQYHIGLANIRRYLNELYPEDACFTEEQLQEQVFYKEFLLYLHQLDYQRAKKIITNVSQLIHNSSKVNQAKKITKTWLYFAIFHLYKEYQYGKYLKKKT